MKKKIATFVLTVSIFAISGCTGIPVIVDRYGNSQPNIQISLSSGKSSSVTEFEARTSFKSDIPVFPLTFFGSDAFLIKQIPMLFHLPYNQDSSLTLHRFNKFQVKFMPMINGSF